MSNPRGQAATFAFSPAAFMAFIDSKSVIEERKRIIRERRGTSGNYETVFHIKVINGKPFNRLHHARAVTRWRHEASGITRRSGTEFLEYYGLTVGSFKRWVKAHPELGPAVLWDDRRSCRAGVPPRKV